VAVAGSGVFGTAASSASTLTGASAAAAATGTAGISALASGASGLAASTGIGSAGLTAASFSGSAGAVSVACPAGAGMSGAVTGTAAGAFSAGFSVIAAGKRRRLGQHPPRGKVGKFFMRGTQQGSSAKTKNQDRRRQDDRGEQETKAGKHGLEFLPP
jgi:hypothetical protein